MPVTLNHTVIPARDKHKSAAFLAGILGLQTGRPFGRFAPVHIGESLSLDFADVDFAGRGVTTIAPHHYAFQVDCAEFDAIFERIVAAGLRYYAEPHEPHRYGEISIRRGGRAVYFDDPDGHIIEVMTGD
jgi:catechol 2,3-dioxygenase-like lactoylglutathione lyase family enzyme